MDIRINNISVTSEERKFIQDTSEYKGIHKTEISTQPGEIPESDPLISPKVNVQLPPDISYTKRAADPNSNIA